MTQDSNRDYRNGEPTRVPNRQWEMTSDLFWEIPFNRRRFPTREPVFLTMWSCPFLRHSGQQTQVRIGTVCIWEQVPWEKSHHLLKRLLRKKKRENVFSFLFSFRYPVRTLDTPISLSQLPSVKCVYTVDYKGVIGGYRTLSVMNSVNQLLIQIGMFWPIRVDHTKFFKWILKLIHS